jgi:hypothetical protein
MYNLREVMAWVACSPPREVLQMLHTVRACVLAAFTWGTPCSCALARHTDTALRVWLCVGCAFLIHGTVPSIVGVIAVIRGTTYMSRTRRVCNVCVHAMGCVLRSCCIAAAPGPLHCNALCPLAFLLAVCVVNTLPLCVYCSTASSFMLALLPAYMTNRSA